MHSYHYVYRITNKFLNKHYYGVRTSKIHPELDLGIKYFSSSSDREFMLDQKVNSQNYKYKIVKMCETRSLALCLEIKLHDKFDVGRNSKFFNKAKQTSTGFNTQGVEFNEDKKRKWSISALKRELNKDPLQKTLIRQKQSEIFKNTPSDIKLLRLRKQVQNTNYQKRSLNNAMKGNYNYYRIYNNFDSVIFEGFKKEFIEWIRNNRAPYHSFMSSSSNNSEIVGFKRRISKKYEGFRGFWVSKNL